MHFTIHHAEVVLPNQDYAVGIEIVGQVGSIGVAGIAEELARVESGGFRQERNHLADSAVVTRVDSEGAAIVVRPNQDNESLFSQAKIARAVARLINPCDLAIHTFTFEPPLED